MNFYKTFFLVAALICIATLSMAQPPCTRPPCPPPTPITGIEVLLGLGGLFGARNLIKSAKRKNL